MCEDNPSRIDRIDLFPREMTDMPVENTPKIIFKLLKNI